MAVWIASRAVECSFSRRKGNEEPVAPAALLDLLAVEPIEQPAQRRVVPAQNRRPSVVAHARQQRCRVLDVREHERPEDARCGPPSPRARSPARRRTSHLAFEGIERPLELDLGRVELPVSRSATPRATRALASSYRAPTCCQCSAASRSFSRARSSSAERKRHFAARLRGTRLLRDRRVSIGDAAELVCTASCRFDVSRRQRSFRSGREKPRPRGASPAVSNASFRAAHAVSGRPRNSLRVARPGCVEPPMRSTSRKACSAALTSPRRRLSIPSSYTPTATWAASQVASSSQDAPPRPPPLPSHLAAGGSRLGAGGSRRGTRTNGPLPAGAAPR